MYPVDLHMHTVASTHAYSTLHDYIAEAKHKGIKLFAITDHGPDMADAPHYWHFMNMRVWPPPGGWHWHSCVALRPISKTWPAISTAPDHAQRNRSDYCRVP
ncbi:Probable phosphatase YcdX [Serratia fonticola]|uniref:Probable phosphatase YcdX n=1 Tax=Serratia fonticola TaxID=47917 RepID=A0A4U9TCU6_SERFO|nr:Probable phosphatase YcdX [Serratia fonticola]